MLESNDGLCNAGIKNHFLDSFPEPLCKLNLKETSEFVKSFPVANNGPESSVIRRNVEAPHTPGRPIFSFSNTSFARKSFPSKWDDAEKWLVSGSSCHDSPAHNNSLVSSRMFTRQCSGNKPQTGEIFAEKSRITEEKVSSQGPIAFNHHNSSRAINGVAHVPLKGNVDKFPNELNPTQEGFPFGNTLKKPINQEMLQQVKHRDIGTETTPLGSSTTSRYPTPFKSTSPARHTTPADRSGPLALTSLDINDMTKLQESRLAKLTFGTQFDSVTSNWSSREEEEDEVSKSLRHFQMTSEFRKSVSELTTSGWDVEEKTKSCHRYQREEAKIQAWVNLESAKAEAESRKLEVKIQKMRANLEEKLMKRMADVHRKAEEWRATAQFQHSEQVRKASEKAQKLVNRRRNKSDCSEHKSCGCFLQ